MAKTWRVSLDQLGQEAQLQFTRPFVEQFADALRRRFPPSLGYTMTGVHAPGGFARQISWNIARGNYWGLRVKVLPSDSISRRIKITIGGYFPLVQRIVDRIRNLISPLDQLRPKFIWHHLLFAPGLIICILILPVIAAYRLATLRMHASVSQAGRELEAIWPAVQAGFPVLVPLSRRPPRSAIYALASVLGEGVAAACFELGSKPAVSGGIKLMLVILGSVASVISFGLVIALIMTLLGFWGD